MLLSISQDRALNERLASELADVDARFAAELLSDLPCVNELVHHIESYRGKMLRPTLVLLSAMASAADSDPLAAEPDVDAVTDAHRVVATVVEMVHMATLVHDDILDDAQMRRRGATVNQLSGNETAVMLGDYLISHAYHLCSSIGRTDISRTIASATNVVCEGELLQLSNRMNWQLDEATYFEIIRRKTASLCGVCCRAAVMLHDHEPSQRWTRAAALYDYGERLGVAFQIVDDVLDLTGDEATVGKTLGRDLEKGKLTLPMIHALRAGEVADRNALRRMLPACGAAAGCGLGPLDPSDLQRIGQILLAGDSVSYAMELAGRYVQSAKQAVLEALHDSPARSLMLEMADAVLTREF